MRKRKSFVTEAAYDSKFPLSEAEAAAAAVPTSKDSGPEVAPPPAKAPKLQKPKKAAETIQKKLQKPKKVAETNQKKLQKPKKAAETIRKPAEEVKMDVAEQVQPESEVAERAANSSEHGGSRFDLAGVLNRVLFSQLLHGFYAVSH